GISRNPSGTNPSGRDNVGALLILRNLAAHLKQVQQGPVDDPLARADLRRRDGRVGAVALLGNGLNGWEILLIVVAVAQEQQVLQPGPAFQAQRMPAEKLARDADDADPSVQQSDGQVRPNAVPVLALVEVDQLAEERHRQRRLHDRIADVDPALEGETFLANFQAGLGTDGAAHLRDQAKNLAP